MIGVTCDSGHFFVDTVEVIFGKTGIQSRTKARDGRYKCKPSIMETVVDGYISYGFLFMPVDGHIRKQNHARKQLRSHVLRHCMMHTSTAKIARKNWPCRTAGNINGWPTILANAEPQIEVAACHPARFAPAYFEFGLSASCCALWRRLEPLRYTSGQYYSTRRLMIGSIHSTSRVMTHCFGNNSAAMVWVMLQLLEATKIYIGQN